MERKASRGPRIGGQVEEKRVGEEGESGQGSERRPGRGGQVREGEWGGGRWGVWVRVKPERERNGTRQML